MMASIMKKTERKYKITVSNGYRADGRKISKAKTITVPDSVPRRGRRDTDDRCGGDQGTCGGDRRFRHRAAKG